MKLTRLNKGSATAVTLSDGTIVLFSYSTPVAACLAGNRGVGFIRTSRKWSKTTSKHINQWLAGARATEVDQSILDNLTTGD